MTYYNLDDRLQENKNVWKEYSEKITIDGIIRTLFIFALIIIVVGYLNQHGAILSLSNIMSDFYANASSELLSIVITVAILERLNSRRADERELTRLKALLGSNESIVTKIAVAELRARGWLDDGSLHKVALDVANLEGASLEGAVLSNASLTLANLRQVNLGSADLSWAILTEADLSQAYLTEAKLVGATFEGANLSRTELAHAKLSGTFLVDVDLSDSNLHGADLSGAFLSNVNLSGAHLENVNLSGAYLLNVNLERSNLWLANMKNTTLSNETIMPDGRAWIANIEIEEYTDNKHPNYDRVRSAIIALRKEKGYRTFEPLF